MIEELEEYVILDSDGHEEAVLPAASWEDAVTRWARGQGDDWEDRVHVVSPDGTIRSVIVDVPAVQPEILHAAVQAEDPRVELMRREEEEAAATEPPKGAWVRCGRWSWATTGAFAVRRDGPRPATMRGGEGLIAAWRRDPRLVDLVRAVRKGPQRIVGAGVCIDPVWASMFCGLSVGMSEDGSAVIGYRDGEPVVMLARLREGADYGVLAPGAKP